MSVDQWVWFPFDYLVDHDSLPEEHFPFSWLAKRSSPWVDRWCSKAATNLCRLFFEFVLNHDSMWILIHVGASRCCLGRKWHAMCSTLTRWIFLYPRFAVSNIIFGWFELIMLEVVFRWIIELASKKQDIRSYKIIFLSTLLLVGI